MAFIIPESQILDNVYLPFHIKPTNVVKTLAEMETVLDLNGEQSILKLTNSDNSDYPFIDFSKWNHETLDWFYVDQFDRLVIITDNNKFMSYYGRNDDQTFFNSVSVPLSMKFNKLTGYNYYEIGLPTSELPFTNLQIYKFQPIQLIVNNIPAKDLTLYYSENISEFTYANPTEQPEFRYLFDGTIATNLDLSNFSDLSIEVRYTYLPNNVSISVDMDSNVGGDSMVTPIIESYIVNMIGQQI